jgi:leucyl-tRNA synthetase
MVQMIDYKTIEAKWQKAWSDAKVFEAEPDDRPALLATFPIPYVNTPLHIGHLRTFGTVDTYVRYKRMRGINVLFPQGFHSTGTPVLAFAKRIANNDAELIEELKMFHVPEDEIKKMTDPVEIVNFFIPDSKRNMTRAGCSIDWRRTFISTEPLFSKLVEWQFAKLKEKGLLTQGRHPVGWCTNENNAVGQHDTKHDVHPEIEEMTVVKFKDSGSGAFFACATYRPETLYGATNIFIGEGVEYAIAEIDGASYYLSKAAADILSYQLGIKITGQISAAELLKKTAINPINGKAVPVLPGYFVKSDVGTGIVMSVPTHAPFDYAALERLKASGYPLPSMEYTKVLEIEPVKGVTVGRSLSDVGAGEAKAEHPEIPALAALEVLHTNPNAIDDMLEFATKLLYREESHWGRMAVGDYKGMPEPEARERIKADLIKSGDAFKALVLGNAEPVYCRCGTRVVIKVVEDQWFINYGDKTWKDSVKDMFGGVRVLPEKYRHTFDNVFDWIDLRAVERAQGLGTPFPFNKSHIIESLSDSTIYMTFYTYVHILRSNEVKPEQLKPEFFDYVIESKGDAEEVAKSTGIDSMVVKKCKDSFEYWYADTSRHSAPDLVPNHLTMYVFNHVALLPKQFWPKQIVVNGFVNYEGEKMSKSLGNIIPLIDGIEQYGADPMRFIEVAGADLDTETEFSANSIESVKSKNEFLCKLISELQTMKSAELSHIDYWLYSKLNAKIRDATECMDGVRIKEAYTGIYYNSVSELRWYFERGGSNAIVLRDFLEAVTLMLAPIMPHIAEEFWQMLGTSALIAKEHWPEFNAQMIDEGQEAIEEEIKRTAEDIDQSMALTAKIDANKGKKLGGIRIIIADDWKVKAFNMLAKTKNISQVMGSSDFSAVDKEVLSKFLTQFSKNMQGLIPMRDISSDAVLGSFVEAKEYLSKRFGADIDVEKESASKSPRASRSAPGKPSIDLSWR